jgi:hypothetical protein
MKRLWIVAGVVLVAATAGCNRWDEYPYGNPYYSPYYQQPYYQQPYYQQPCPPGYQPATTYVQPSAGPCSPAAVRPAASR